MKKDKAFLLGRFSCIRAYLLAYKAKKTNMMAKNNDYIRRLINEAVGDAFTASEIDGLLSILRPMGTSFRSVYEKVRRGDLLDNEVGQFCMYCQRYDAMFRKLTTGRF